MTEIEALSDDLMVKILLLLSVKNLLRLKIVSKRWHSLITDPNFSRQHNTTIERHHHIVPSGLFLFQFIINKYEFLSLHYNDLCISSLKSLGPLDFPSRITILHSCNGLLCCSTVNPIEFTAEFFIFNPTTKQSTPLPRPCKGTNSSVVYGMTLAFDPAISPHYKVVSVQSSSISSDQYWVEIYLLETCQDTSQHCWRVSGKPFTPTGYPKFSNGVYWNGAVHWVSHQGDSLYFDIAQEQVLKMPMPPNPGEIRNICYFGESEGHLYLVDKYETHTLTFDVYELDKNYSGWFVKYQVDLRSIASAFPWRIIDDLYGYFRVVIFSIVWGETEEESFLVLYIKGLIIRYKFTDKNYRVIGYCDSSVRFGGWFNAHPYFESLACV